MILSVGRCRSSSILLNAVGVEWLYKALEKYVYITVRSVFFKLVALIAMFLMVRNENDYIVYGAITVFASAASNIVNFCGIHRYADLRPAGRHDLKRHIPAMLMLFAAYGVQIAKGNARLRRGFAIVLVVEIFACIAWNWFKLAGRGMI